MRLPLSLAFAHPRKVEILAHGNVEHRACAFVDQRLTFWEFDPVPLVAVKTPDDDLDEPGACPAYTAFISAVWPF